MLGKLIMGAVAAVALGLAGCAGPQAVARKGLVANDTSRASSASGHSAAGVSDPISRSLGMASGGDLSDSQDPIPIVPSPVSPSDATLGRWPGDGMGGHRGGNPVARWSR